MRSEKQLKKRTIVISLLIGLASFAMYSWTINLPVIGDGLMHMNDNTDLSFLNMLKSFYTFDGLNKPMHSYLLGFHRPVFDEIIIEVLKKISGNSVLFIRMATVCGFAVSSVIAYLIGKELFSDNEVKAVALPIMLACSIARFPGIYEVGLSFSVWLVLFQLLAFYFTLRYLNTDRTWELFAAIAATGLALFTKESAMTLGIALASYVFIKEYAGNKKVTWKFAVFCILQAILLVFYLITRYLKLGTLFEVAGGIDAGSISLIECIKKVIGFFLLCFNIPTKVCFETYMCTQLNSFSVVIAIILGGVLLYALCRCIGFWKQRNVLLLDVASYLFCFVVVILPVFKTTRNATYYGDILAIFVILLVLTVFKDNRLSKCALMICVCCYTMVFCATIYDNVKPNSTYYLSVTSNEANTLKNNLLDKEIETDKVYVSTNWMKNSDSHFTYNHMGYGSFYRFNINPKIMTDVTTADNMGDISNVTVIDYYRAIDTGTYKTFLYDEKSNCGTRVVEVTYNPNVNQKIAVGFFYEDQYYYSEIDTSYKRTWCADQKLFFVIPNEVVFDIVGNECSVTTIYE